MRITEDKGKIADLNKSIESALQGNIYGDMVGPAVEYVRTIFKRAKGSDDEKKALFHDELKEIDDTSTDNKAKISTKAIVINPSADSKGVSKSRSISRSVSCSRSRSRSRSRSTSRLDRRHSKRSYSRSRSRSNDHRKDGNRAADMGAVKKDNWKSDRKDFGRRDDKGNYLQQELSSAIVEFSSAAEAQEALKSNIPVLNDRFIEVVSMSATKTDNASAGTDNSQTSVASGVTDEAAKAEEVNKKLDLIRQRQLYQLQELKSKRNGVKKYIILMGQYAQLWERSKDEARLPHEERMRNVARKVFADAQDIYHRVKVGVEKVDAVERVGETVEGDVKPVVVIDNAERAKMELEKILDDVREVVRSTTLYEEIDKDATDVLTQILDENAREMDVQRNAISSGFRTRGRGRDKYAHRGRGSRFVPRPAKVDTSKFQLDLRSNVLMLKGLETDINETDIREAMKEFQGVRDVKLENGEASVIFEQHWQTNKPIKAGIKLHGKVITPVVSAEPYVVPPSLPEVEVKSVEKETIGTENA